MRRLKVPQDPNNPNPLVDNTSFDLGSRFDIPAMFTRLLGGISQGRDMSAGQNVMQQVFEKGRKLDPSQYSFDDQVRLIKDALDRVQKGLANVIDPQLVEKMRDQSSRALEVYADMRRDAEAARKNSPALQQEIADLRVRQQAATTPAERETLEKQIRRKEDLVAGGAQMADKLDAMASVALGPVGSSLNIKNQEKLEDLMRQLAADSTISDQDALKAASKAAGGLNAKEIMTQTTAGRYFTGGYYQDLMQANNGRIESNSEEFNMLVEKGRRGVSEGVRGLQRAEKYKELGTFGRMMGGISASDLGINEGDSRKVLSESLKASKDRLKELSRDEAEIRAEMAEATKGKTGSERAAAAKPFEENLADIQGKRQEVAGTALEAAKQLSENIKRPFMEAGAHFKSAMSGVISMLGTLGNEISRQISGLAKATLNPVVGDLIDSIKYGLSLGMQAGQMISNVTKNTLDGMSKTFGFGGGLGNLLGGGAGGTLGKLAKAGGIALGGAALGYGVGELIRGGISKDAREGRVEMNQAEKRTAVWASTAQGALTGAGMGLAVGGLPGAAVGAALGGIGGWISGKFEAEDSKARVLRQQNEEKKAAKEAEKAKKEEGLAAGFMSGITSFADVDKMVGKLSDTKLGTLPFVGDVTAGGVGKTLLATGAAGVIGGNLPGAGVARGLFAASSGLLGGAAVGAAATVVDFFIKSLQRGAEELGKFNQVSNNLNIGMSMQLRRLGNVQGEGKGLGEKSKLTEADLAQSLLTGTKLIDIGFNREQVGAAYATMNRTSYEGTVGATSTIELAGRAARQLGVDINEMLQSYSQADVLGGVGKGAELYNRVLFGTAPKTEDGDVSAMSKAYTEAILNSARQLQMGAKTITAGENITGLLASIGGALQREKGSFSEFAKLNPQVIGETVSSMNSFLRGGLSGDPMALNFAARAGLNRRTMYEGIQTTGEFESVINTMASVLSGGGIENGEITEEAKRTILPDLLNTIMPGVSTEQFATMYKMASSGDVSGAMKYYKEEAKPMTLEEIAKQIGQGFVSLQKLAEEGMQQNLKLMEGNMQALKDLSAESNKVAGNLLSMGKTFLKPAIESLNYPMKTLADITKLANDTIKQQAEAKRLEEESKKNEGRASVSNLERLSKSNISNQGIKSAAVDTAEEVRELSRQQFSLLDARELTNKALTSGGGFASAKSFVGLFDETSSNKPMSWLFDFFSTTEDPTSSKALISSLSKGNNKASSLLAFGSNFDFIKGPKSSEDFNQLLQSNQELRKWFFQFNPNEDSSKAKAELSKLFNEDQIKEIFKIESFIDVFKKMKNEGLEITSETMQAYVTSKGNTSDPIYQAIASGKKYVFLANDLQAMDVSEFRQKVDTVK